MNSFLHELYRAVPNPENQYFELRAFDANANLLREFFPLNKLNKVEQFINKNGNDYDCYYGVASRSNNKSGKKDDCLYLPAIYIDIDCDYLGRSGRTYFKDKDTALKHINHVNLGETAIVDSGNGFHVYWFFEEPIKLNNLNLEMVEELMKNVSRIFGGDLTYDASRILRIPDSLNLKNEPKECKVVQSNYNRKYTLAELVKKMENHPAYSLPFEKFFSLEINKMLFGNYDEKKFKSRSEADQKIITWLIICCLSQEQIHTIFKTFPTTGKYLEKLLQNEKQANDYLDHSIENANKYLESNKDAILIDELKYENSATIDDEYELRKDANEFGYYKIIYTTKGTLYKRMSNFHIVIHKQVKKLIDNNVTSCFCGEIFFADGSKFYFDNLPADYLASIQELKKYLMNNFGTRVKFIQFVNQIPEAIKTFSKKVEEIVSKDFGYSEDLSEYVTSDLTITKDSFTKKETPLLFDNIGNKNYLGFCKASEEIPLEVLKHRLIENLFSWDKPEVILYSLSFTFLPIIFPFIREYCNGKPYLILHGNSGCGKSTMIHLMQSFYGEIRNLTSFSSTPNSLEIKGHSFKDALYCIDDMKLQNINERDRGKIQLLFQNYSDETGRNRANVNLDLREQRYMRGILMVSAEDIVLTESSTLARGLVVPVEDKEPNNEGRNMLVSDSKNYQLVMKHFIHNFLNMVQHVDFHEMYKQKQEEINEITKELALEGGNLPRLINNFSVVSVAFEFMINFLFGVRAEEEIQNRKMQFKDVTKHLLLKNFQGIQELKPEEKFEQTLWEMIEMKLLHIVPIDQEHSVYCRNDEIVGYVQFKEDGTEKLCINMNNAYRRVNQFLQNEGGIGHSKPTIVQKLLTIKKIRIPSQNGLKDSRVSFSNKAMKRGVEWIGEVSYKHLGIPIPLEYERAKRDKEAQVDGLDF